MKMAALPAWCHASKQKVLPTLMMSLPNVRGILDYFFLRQERPKGRSFPTFKFMHGFTGLYTW
jgi:hypothetical protein